MYNLDQQLRDCNAVLAALPQHLHDLGTRLRHALRRGDTAEALAVAAMLEQGQYRLPTATEDLRCTKCGAQDWTWWYNDAVCRPVEKVGAESKRFHSDFSEWVNNDSPGWEARNRLTCNECEQLHEIPEGWREEGHREDTPPHRAPGEGILPELDRGFVSMRERLNEARAGIHSNSDHAAYGRLRAFQAAPEYNELLTEVGSLEDQDTPSEDGCGCPGWGLFDTGSWLEVERCDECERFENDEAAARHVIALLREQGTLEALATGLPVCEDPNCDLCWLQILLPWYEPETAGSSSP